MVKEEGKNKKLALAIFSAPEYTAPCVLFYLRNFLKAYNKINSDETIKIDDPFNRYSNDLYLDQVI